VSELSIRVGDTIKVAEGDYRHGDGTLTIRIQGLLALPCEPGLVAIRGVEIGYDGEEQEQRTAIVRRAGMLRVDS
jgi:hypothetical protein